MAKAISSDYSVNGEIAVYTLKDETSGETQAFTLNLGALVANPAEALKALANGVRIRMREATGGKSFADAVSLLGDFAAAINGGSYPTRQREAGETRTSPFIVALANCFYDGDTATAQAEYDKAVADKAAQLGVDLDDESDEGKKKAARLKRDLRAKMTETPKVAAELERLKLAAAEAAIVRQRERAAAAAAKADAASA